MLISRPRLVRTSLSLIDFRTFCWYETDQSVYVMGRRRGGRRTSGGFAPSESCSCPTATCSNNMRVQDFTATGWMDVRTGCEISVNALYELEKDSAVVTQSLPDSS